MDLQSELFVPTGTKDNWGSDLTRNFFEPGPKIPVPIRIGTIMVFGQPVKDGFSSSVSCVTYAEADVKINASLIWTNPFKFLYIQIERTN